MEGGDTIGDRLVATAFSLLSCCSAIQIRVSLQLHES
jgi:hypothetical protein